MRVFFVSLFLILVLITMAVFQVWQPIVFFWIILGPLSIIGFIDMIQRKSAIRRNFPLLGHFRFFFESIRPEIQQYFIETNTAGVPFSREKRSVVYQRSKKVLDTQPFGTQYDLNEIGYEWVNHSLLPKEVRDTNLRTTIGGADCKNPYSASLLNISAMSFGSLSSRAIEALNLGAQQGGFAHNTGEGAISPYHLKGGDLIWQLGTGYFGARTKEGKFSPEMFAEKAKIAAVKMIEIKLSQGAKPGHGGILPASKVAPEIAKIRSVTVGEEVISPPSHTAFSTPIEMMEFVGKLRELSDGKPIGLKLCLGRRREFISMAKAMVETGIKPDFITVDGAEGGTGAAPIEFANHIGSPLREAIITVNNILTGFNLRKDIKIIASGKIITGFDMVRIIALGADLCYSARGMMLSIGCIQALRCNTNHCPVGIATQNKSLESGIIVPYRAKRAASYHQETLKSFAEIIGAMGFAKPQDLRPWHIFRRIEIDKVRNYSELYQYIEPGSLLEEPYPSSYARAVKSATAEDFDKINLV